MKKKVIIYLSAILFSLLCTTIIVLCYIKNKSNIVTCSVVYKDNEYEIKTEIEISYKDNKIISHKKIDYIESNDEDLLKIQQLQYEKDGYEINHKNEKLVAVKNMKTNEPPKKLINEYLKSGYNCNK